MEAAEVQQKDQAKESGPPAKQILIFRNTPRNHPQQPQSQSRLEGCPEPVMSRGLDRMLVRIEKSLRVHSGPSHEVSERTCAAVCDSRASLPPGHPLQAGKNGERQDPHEQPGGHSIPERDRERGEKQQRKCLSPQAAFLCGIRRREDRSQRMFLVSPAALIYSSAKRIDNWQIRPPTPRI